MQLCRSAMLWLSTVFWSATLSAQSGDFAGVDFAKADSIAERYAAHSLYEIKGLADRLTVSLTTEHEKFRAIYKWVCTNIEVDFDLVERNRQKRNRLSGEKLVKWNEQFNREAFETLLDERRTVCTGYAYLIRELAYHAGLRCEVVNGFAKPGGVAVCDSRPANHSWNKVYLNGKAYYCDPTWSSGPFCLQTRRFIPRYNDQYFLPDPLFFSTEHCIETVFEGKSLPDRVLR